MNKNTHILTITYWIMGVLFLAMGLAYIPLVHIIPGLIYLFLALLYLPPSSRQISFGFTVPDYMKITFALLVVWYTLAVGELVEMLD